MNKHAAAWKEANPDKARETRRKTHQKNKAHYNAYAIQWHKDNPEWQKEWYKANPGKGSQYSKRWRSKNREHVRAYQQRRAAANPELIAEYARQRRARVANAPTIKFSTDDLADRMAYWGDRCWMCGGPFETVDHVKPLSKGGYHTLANLRPACFSCNSQKKDKWPFDVRLGSSRS